MTEKVAFVIIFLLWTTFALTAQTFNVPQTGEDTSTSCFGLLRDPGGTGNYAAYSDGYFVIDPPGNNTVSVIFSSFYTQQFSDYVYVYDGIGTGGTLLGSYSGTSLPAGGNTITSTSGAITVRFYSNCCTHYSGFQLSWTTTAGSLPNASFAVNTAPAYNTPVQFINTTTNGGDYLWEFGDGTTSTEANPIHSYTISGPVQARLIVTNCTGSDTSAYKTLTVQAAPAGSISTDTVTLTVPCGSSNSGSFTVSNTGSGSSMSYGLTLNQATAGSVFSEDFEGGTLGGFVNQNSTYTTTTLKSSGAPQGTNYIEVSGSGYVDDALRATIVPSMPEYISYRIMDNAYGSYHGYVSFRGLDNFNSMDNIFMSYFRYNELRLLYVDQNGYSTYYSHTITQGTWYQVELKNIDFVNHTFDIYINGAMVVSGGRFLDLTINSVSEINVYNSYSYNFSIDDFEIAANDLLNKITYNPKTGTLNGGSSNIIFINADATGLNAGTYWLNFKVTSNDTALNGLVIPLKLIVTGTANLNLGTACLNFGTVYTGFNAQDSLLLWNSGCDTLDFDSIVSTNPDITANLSSFQIAPGDSLQLLASVNATTIGTYTDTLYLYGPDTNTYVCIGAQSAGAPVIATDSTSYNVSYTGCNDSVSFPIVIYNNGQGDLNWNTSSLFNSNVNDDFEGALINTSIWAQWNSGVSQGSLCGTITGSKSLAFYGASGSRYITTVPLTTSSGGTISFTLDQGTCEYADGGEGIYLDYSVDNGLTWTNINYYYTSGNLSVSEPIPAGAQGSNIIFRLQQSTNSGSTYDNWILDDFEISANIGNALVFSPDTGLVTASDSIVVNVKIGVAGLTTGSYTFQVYISSNDPVNPIYSVPVNLNLIGVPDIAVQPACQNFDTAMTGASNIDSVRIVNNGCGDLVLSGLTTSTTEFSVISGLSTIPPGDTSYIKIQFTASATLGVINDTLSIASNDTLAEVCLAAVAIGAPNVTVSPDSIYASFTSCNDSVTVPVTISNVGGNGLLDFDISGNKTTGTRRILAYLSEYRYYEYSNVKSILQGDASNKITEEFSYSIPVLQGHLDTCDLVLIPESYSNSTFWTQAGAALQTYCNNGGTVVILYNPQSVIQNLNLIPGFTTTSGVSANVYNNDPVHPIMSGFPSFVSSLSATMAINHTSGTEILLSPSSTASTPSVASVTNVGSGKVIFIGFDYYQYNTDIGTLLKNAVAWGAKNSLPDYITVTPDSGSVAIDDSITLNVTISSAGLQNGTYTATVVVQTNDPLNPLVHIPVVAEVNGAPEINISSSSCASFTGILQGATATDSSIVVVNTGCDTLDVTGFTGSSAEFGISNLPLYLPPGDSAHLLVTFNPTTVGTFSDTLTITNNDTAITICANGTSAGAPVLNVITDTLEVNLNKCKVIKNVSYNIQNTGLGILSYGINIGNYSGVNQETYNTAGATTYHTFNGVPSSDTLMVRVILKGDYDDYYERAYLRIDNYSYSYVYDNNLNHINDTVDFLIWGTNALNWTSDGTLNIELQNSTSVDGSAGSFHQVEVFLPAQVSWASVVGTTTGNISPGASVNKTILFNAAALNSGTYITSMNISSNAPGAPNVSVPVKLNVANVPEIAIQDSCLFFPLTLVGDTSVNEFYIHNKGCADLNIASIVSSNSVFKVSPSSGIVAVDDSIKVTVEFIPTSSKTYNSSFIITSNDSVKVLCVTAIGGIMPTAGFVFNYEDPCLGEVAFSSNSQNATSYLWNFGDGNTSSQATITHYYAKPGTYKVLLKASNSSGFDTISKTVTVNPLYVNFSMTNDTVLQGTSVNFYDSSAVPVSWTWNFGDGSTAAIQNPSHTYNNLGKYQVNLEVDDANGCTRNITKDLYVVDEIGLNDNTIDGYLYWLYPNPSEGIFVFETNKPGLTEYEFVVTDLRGKVVLKIHADQEYKVLIDLAGFSPGMYHLTIVKGDTVKTNGMKLILH